jgi:hypothetical protein
MNNFEQKILNMKSSSHPNSDSGQFLSKLHGRIEESEQNKKTIMTSFIMIFVIGFLSWSQLGVSINEDIFPYFIRTVVHVSRDVHHYTVGSKSLDEATSRRSFVLRRTATHPPFLPPLPVGHFPTTAAGQCGRQCRKKTTTAGDILLCPTH